MDKDSWNKIIDTVDANLSDIYNSNFIKYINNYLHKEDGKTKSDVVKLIEKSENKQDNKLNIMNDEIIVSYKFRRNFVFYSSLGVMLMYMKPVRRFLFTYFILSLFFCRENFILENYKI
jgi:hypothetical protein